MRNLYLLVAILSFIMLILVSCHVIRIKGESFFIEYPGDGEENVPLKFNLKIHDPSFSRAVNYDVYLNGELIKRSVNATEIALDKRLNPGEEYVLMVIKKVFDEKEVGRDVVKFKTTHRPVFVYINPRNGEKIKIGMKLRWKAIDPDNDRIVYDVYVGKDEQTLVKVAGDIENEEYKIDPEGTGLYVWKVVAKDSKGATSSTQEIISLLSYPSIRYKLASVVNSNELWFLDLSDNDSLFKVYSQFEMDESIKYIRFYKNRLIVKTQDYIYVYENAFSNPKLKASISCAENVESMVQQDGYILGMGKCFFIFDPDLERFVGRSCGDIGRYYIATINYNDFMVMRIIAVEDKFRITIDFYDSEFENLRHEEMYVNFNIWGIFSPGSNEIYFVAVDGKQIYLFHYVIDEDFGLDVNNPNLKILLYESDSVSEMDELYANFWSSYRVELNEKFLIVDLHKYGIYFYDPDRNEVSKALVGATKFYPLPYFDFYIKELGDNDNGVNGIHLYYGSDNEEISWFDPDGGIGKLGDIVSVGNYVFALNTYSISAKRRIVVFNDDLELQGFIGDKVGDNNSLWSLLKYNGVLIVADYSGGIRFVDVSDVNNPKVLSEISGVNDVYGGVYVNDGYAYIYNVGKNLLYIYDISDIKNPQQISASYIQTNFEYPASIIGNDSILVIWKPGGLLTFVDISDKFNPKFISSIQTESRSATNYPILVGERYLYVIDGTHIYVYELNEDNITNIRTINISGYIGSYLDSAIMNHYILLEEGAKLHVLDVADPENPHYLGNIIWDGASYLTKIYANDIDQYLIVSSELSGIFKVPINAVLNSIGGVYKPDSCYKLYHFYDVAVGE